MEVLLSDAGGNDWIGLAMIQPGDVEQIPVSLDYLYPLPWSLSLERTLILLKASLLKSSTSKCTFFIYWLVVEIGK